MTECKMYGCKKQVNPPLGIVDIWGFCDQHAEEYRKRFADALKDQQAKRDKNEKANNNR